MLSAPVPSDPTIRSAIAEADYVLGFISLASILGQLRHRADSSQGAADGHWQTDCEGTVEVTVWDSEVCLPADQAADPSGRAGQHGLEIVLAVCRSFEMHREPVGKRFTAAVALADDTAGDQGGDAVC
ncbi:ATP-binding protein [Streptomyces griseofuscus]|uniref:hypothetical protein n=1 Tax=Streptomyces griseofuscus TaxID=146922 RepID=UPI00380EDB70